MTGRMTSVLLALFLAMGASGALAHDGHDHKIMGTVTMAAADHVMLKATDGKDVTVLVTKDTKVTRNNVAMKAADIKVGTRIVVTAVTEKTKTTAKDIQVGAEPAAR